MLIITLLPFNPSFPRCRGTVASKSDAVDTRGHCGTCSVPLAHSGQVSYTVARVVYSSQPQKSHHERVKKVCMQRLKTYSKTTQNHSNRE